VFQPRKGDKTTAPGASPVYTDDRLIPHLVLIIFLRPFRTLFTVLLGHRATPGAVVLSPFQGLLYVVWELLYFGMTTFILFEGQTIKPKDPKSYGHVTISVEGVGFWSLHPGTLATILQEHYKKTPAERGM